MNRDLDIDLLRAFAAVAQSGGFTAAAGQVGRSQSAVSQKVLRLEEIVGQRLFERTSRTLKLTLEGERFLVSARRMLELNDLVIRELRAPAAIGNLRLGVAEDFVPRQLPQVLARFRRLHPGVHLELTTGLSHVLLDAHDSGELDAVIAKAGGGDRRGRVIWRENIVWIAAASHVADYSRPTPLVMLRAPCCYRQIMIQALDSVRCDWFAACTTSSLMGVRAAVAGGLGMTVLGRSFVDDDIRIVRPPEHWPALPMAEIVLIGEDSDKAHLIEPLVAFLTESLVGSGAVDLA